MRKKVFFMAGLVLFSLACSLTAAPSPAARADTLSGGAPVTPAEIAGVMPTATPSPMPTAAPARSPALSVAAESMGMITGENVNLRACAGTQCESLGILKAGQVVTVTGSQTAPDGGAWANIQTPAGVTGWVNSKYLRTK